MRTNFLTPVGDEFRRINWKAFARTQGMMYKERRKSSSREENPLGRGTGHEKDREWPKNLGDYHI